MFDQEKSEMAEREKWTNDILKQKTRECRETSGVILNPIIFYSFIKIPK